ncbi:MAG: secondary thiamine-phosphate synthase enzyme YjbQ [Acidobacteriota bacterium]
MYAKSFTLKVEAQPTCDVVDLTSQVADHLRESGLREGTVTLFVVGSTAGITTVEFEPGLIKDLEEFFEKVAPATRDYHHEQMWHDGNGYSHIRASLLGPSLTVPFREGRMRLGTWQQIVLINFDNRARSREVAMQVVGTA